MVASNFDKSLKRVLVYEGGYSNHPSDPGGPTMKGVIQRVYDGYRERKGLPKRSVKYLAEDELKEIYRKQYWDAIRGDELPHGVDFVVFDGAVNSGPSQSAKWLQRAVGTKDDGNVGEATIAAAIAKDRARTINGICDRRLSFLKALRTWPVFGVGWGRRVADVRRWGLSFAKVSVPEPKPAPLPEVPSGKAEMDPTPPPTKTGGFRAIVAIFLSNIGAGLAAMFDDWRIVAAFVALIVFLTIYLGREWVKKLIEERL
jgi:lysozyme family protein